MTLSPILTERERFSRRRLPQPLERGGLHKTPHAVLAWRRPSGNPYHSINFHTVELVIASRLFAAARRRTVVGAATLAACAIAAGAARAEVDILARDGQRAFDTLWSVSPSAFGTWGRGPTSNAERCGDCHGAPGDAPAAPLARIAARDARGRPARHPVYGSQLQTQGVLGRVPAEGQLRIRWRAHVVRLADGTVVSLRTPRVRLDALAFGPLAHARVSLRIAPPLHGLGLLAAVPDGAIEALAGQASAPGARGRVQRVPDPVTGAPTMGRFGHKAGQPTLLAQAALALHEDLGVTSRLHPAQNCPPLQRACAAEPAPGAPEASDALLEDLVAHLSALPPPPAAAGLHPEGERTFHHLGCAACHRPSLPVAGIAGASEARAFTDLLLHDLGPGLADGGPEHAAGPRHWRTAPLWGLSRRLHAGLLHDGRARTVQEAVLWHGGEAAAARRSYAALPAARRAELLRFLESL